jgi:choline transporter-like protein 2/4/5
MKLCGCCKGKKEAGLKDIKRDRGCTDILCLVIFIAFLFTVIVLGYVGLSMGDPDSMMYGTDHEGNTCGGLNLNKGDTKKDLTKRKFIVYPRMTEDVITQMEGGELPTDITSLKFFGICLEKCPTVGDWVCTDKYSDVKTSDLDDCTKESGGGAFASLFKGYTNDKCATYLQNCFKTPVDTYDVFFRCISNYTTIESNKKVACNNPTNVSATNNGCQVTKTTSTITKIQSAQKDVIAEQMSSTVMLGGQLLKDVEVAYVPIFAIGCGLAIILGFLWLNLLRCFAKCMVWTTVFLVGLCFAILVFYTGRRGGFITAADATVVSGTVADDVTTAGSDIEMWKTFFYVSAAFAIIYLLVIVSMWKKINIAAAIIQEASKAVNYMKTIVVFPLSTVISTVSLFGIWLYCFMGLYTTGAITAADLVNAASNYTGTGNFTSEMTEFKTNDYRDLIVAYWVFAGLWLLNFFLGIAIMTVCGAFADWYWTQGNTEKFPVAKSMWRTVRYHLGSIAFGSLLIALVQFARIILEYVDRKTKTLQEKNKGMKYLIQCLKCVLACFEKCIKYLTRTAYIIIAIRGVSFCSAGITVFHLLTNHAKQIGITLSISSVMMLLGKIVITGGCGFAGFAWITMDPTYSTKVFSPILPIILCALLGYIVGSAFLFVYDLGIETLLVSFCIDKDENTEGTYRCSPSLARAAGITASSNQKAAELPKSEQTASSAYVVPDDEKTEEDGGNDNEFL